MAGALVQRSHIFKKTKTIQDRQLDFAIRDISDLIACVDTLSVASGNLGIQNLTSSDDAREFVLSGDTTASTLSFKAPSMQILTILGDGQVWSSGKSGVASNTVYGAWASALGTASGVNNSFFGNYSATAISTGGNNSGFGHSALNGLTEGSRNTSIGEGSLYNISTTNNNVGVGYQAGRFITGSVTANTGASDSIYIGMNTKAGAISETNQIVIGYNATGNGSNTVTIGDDNIGNNYFSGSMTLNTSGNGSYAFFDTDVSFLGRFTHATLTGNRVWSLPDASGTIALTSDIAASNELSEILGNGNTTGGTDISITNGDEILFNGANNLGYNQLGYGTVDMVVSSPTQGFATGTVGGDVVSISPNGMTMLSLLSMPTISFLGVAGTQGGTLTASASSSGETWTLPNGTGTIALISDTASEWSTFTGTRVGGDLVATLGDFDSSNNGVRIVIDDSGEFINLISTDEIKATIGNQVLSFAQENLTIETGSVNAPGINFNSTGFDGKLTRATNLGAARTWTLPDATGDVALTSDITGGFTLDDAANIVLNTTTGTKIGTATSQKLGFFNSTPVVQPTAITTAETTLTFVDENTPDFALSSLTTTTPAGFATLDEAQAFVEVVANLQTRVADLESKLQSLGLIA